MAGSFSIRSFQGYGPCSVLTELVVWAAATKTAIQADRRIKQDQREFLAVSGALEETRKAPRMFTVP